MESVLSAVLKGFQVIKRAIVVQDQASPLLKGEVEADEVSFDGGRQGKRSRGAAGKVPVFGILEREGQVRVEVVPDVRASPPASHREKSATQQHCLYR